MFVYNDKLEDHKLSWISTSEGQTVLFLNNIPVQQVN